VPPPPPAKEGVPPPAPLPPAVLSPQVGQADEDRLKRDSTTHIQKAEDIIKQVSQKKLNKDQQDTLSTVQSFLANAKEAMAAQDFLRASNLATKAQVLAEELFRALQ
jgi:flagellin-specific chaperone FliS